jgi:hypothetical protein
MFGSVIHLQNLVLIVAFLHRKVDLENQVRPSYLGSNACHRRSISTSSRAALHRRRMAPRHDFGLSGSLATVA